MITDLKREITNRDSDLQLLKMSTEKGYSIWTATIFMVSFNAGLGLLAMPHSLSGTGWFGILLILLASINSCYSAVILGRTWLIMEKKWEEYRGKFRYPYPAMGMRAVGPWMRYVVTGTLHISAIGVGVVYLLLSAQVASSLTESFFSLGYNYWIIILAVMLGPLTWFGSIEKFKFAAIGALASMVFACVAMLVGTLLDFTKAHEAIYEKPSFSSSSLAFGTILFAFGGIFFFPTVQNDMKYKQQFQKATFLSFITLVILYLPITVAGYLVFGSNVASNIVLSLEKGYIRTFTEICLAVHTFLAFLLGINPVLQEVEEVLNIPKVFNYKRCVARTIIVCIILAVAYTIPHFDKVLNLIGGSTMTLLTFIFPSIFYFMIQQKDSKLNDAQRQIGFIEGLFLIQIILVGIAGGISCTYFAVIDIAQTFQPDQEQVHFNSTV